MIDLGSQRMRKTLGAKAIRVVACAMALASPLALAPQVLARDAAIEGGVEAPLEAVPAQGAVEVIDADRRGDDEAGLRAGAESGPDGGDEAGPDATSRAVLEAVQALERTSFGQWLRAHELAWNAIALGALAALAFAGFVVVRGALRGIVRTALAKAGREAAAREVERARIPGVVGLMAVLLVVARVVGALGGAELLHPLAAAPLANLLSAVTVLLGVVLAGRLLTVADELYSARPEVNRKGALAGYRQVAMVPIGLIGVISAVAIAVGKSPVVFLAALGALAAVVGVVFKDFILSLVANLMLTATDAIRAGDWVELKQHGIDGRIAEIKATAVRVQNADGTVHSVPIARFVQEPYLNYRSKYGSPGRRVRRAMRVDARSVRTLGAGELEALARDAAMAAAIERARRTAAAGGALTNLACFKAAVESMLAGEETVDDTLPIALTQGEAAPGALPAGIAIELLCFLKPAPLAEMTAKEGALLDRILVAMPAWGLRPFQSGGDLPGLEAPLPTGAAG